MNATAQRPRTMRDFLTWLYARSKRVRSDAAYMQDALAMRESFALCQSCSAKMGRKWQLKFGYVPFGEYPALGLCDYCQAPCTRESRGTLWLPEEGDFYQQGQQIQRTVDGAIRVTDRRRVS